MTNVMTPHDDRPQLVPARVPWCVAPRSGCLAVACYTDSEDRPTEVSFRGLWLREPQAGPFELHIFKLTFDHALAARLVRADGELWGFDLLAYQSEEDAETGEADGAIDLARGAADLEGQWRATGICPSPHVYEVVRSEWMRELAADEDAYKHFLLADQAARVDVIAAAWRWESVEHVGEIAAPWMA
jgi:hypothetical protein